MSVSLALSAPHAVQHAGVGLMAMGGPVVVHGPGRDHVGAAPMRSYLVGDVGGFSITLPVWPFTKAPRARSRQPMRTIHRGSRINW
jgi:hypothetical protein